MMENFVDNPQHDLGEEGNDVEEALVIVDQSTNSNPYTNSSDEESKRTSIMCPLRTKGGADERLKNEDFPRNQFKLSRNIPLVRSAMPNDSSSLVKLASSVALPNLDSAKLNDTGFVMTRSHAGQLVSFSICLFALFIVSTYTANLASFLVIQKAASSEIVNSVEDIVKYGKSICVYGDTAANNEIRGQYPTASIVKRIDEKDVLMGLKEDDCDYGVMSLAAYELFRGQIDVNGDCDLIRIGRNFRDLEDGFATISDAGTLCTSMIRDVINIHMQDMHDDGFIDKVWDEYYGRKHNIDDATCFNDSASGGSSSSDGETLDFLNMGGIFLLHGATLLVAILVFFYEAYMRKDGILKQHQSFETGGRLGARRHPDRKGSMEMMKMNDVETVRTDTSSLVALRKEVSDLSKAVNNITVSLVKITNMLEKNQKNGMEDDDLSVSESFANNPVSPDLSIMKNSMSSSTTQSIKGDTKTRIYDLSIISKV